MTLNGVMGCIAIVKSNTMPIVWLGAYMLSSPGRRNFGLPHVRVIPAGAGGATLRTRPRWRQRRGQWRRQWCMADLLSDVEAYHPDLIFLHIGENDLRGMCKDDIVYHIIRTANQLSGYCTFQTVIVGQLIPFPVFSRAQRDSVFAINRALRQFLEPTPHTFWSHRAGFTQTSPELFLHDQVHLSDDGMHRYWKSVCAVVGRVLRQHRSS